MGFEFIELNEFIEFIELLGLLGIGAVCEPTPIRYFHVRFVLFGDGLVDIHAESAV